MLHSGSNLKNNFTPQQFYVIEEPNLAMIVLLLPLIIAGKLDWQNKTPI